MEKPIVHQVRIHIDAPNLYRNGPAYVEFEDVDWKALIENVIGKDISPRIHLYISGFRKSKYKNIISKGILPGKVDVHQPPGDPYSDIDGTLIAFLIVSTLRNLDRLPPGQRLHIVVMSGDGDYISAYKILKEIANAEKKDLFITVAAWKENLPTKYRSALERWVDELIELEPI